MARKKKFELNDNNLAIAYYRFSSHSQNEASIDQQRELAHAWADAHGFKIVKEYEDAAISGTTENRPGFQQMLSEVAKIRPRVLIMWKTDRLGRDKYVLAMAKRTIRDAGCEIRLLAENIPTDGPEGVLIEGLMDAMAEYYSRQLSQNIQRGMDYNAQHALYNGHKLFGYGVDKSTKRYIVDPDTAPFVQRMFAEYAAGKAMQTICDELNAQGLRTTRGAKFGVKTMNKMLQKRAYIGEYRHGDIVVEGGMPALVDEETFDKVQRKFAENKRKGSQRARGMDENDAPRYWLTGKVYCGKCGNTLQGVSGTSGTGRTYYYYYCSAQRRKQCTLKKVRKEKLEDAVTMILRSILHDSENLMSLAVDAAAYYADAVYWARLHGVVQGVSEERFAPDSAITREQLATMLYRYAQYQGMEATTLEENLGGYADAAEVSEYAVQAMNWAVGAGIIEGFDNDTLRPQGEATRAQAATMLMRFAEYLAA